MWHVACGVLPNATMTAAIKVVVGACDASRLPLEERHSERQEKCKRQWLGISESKVCTQGPKRRTNRPASRLDASDQTR